VLICGVRGVFIYPGLTAMSYKKIAVSILAIIIASALACSKGSRPSGNPLYMPECLIIKADSLREDPTVKAYGEVLDSVSLNYRIESASRIEKLRASGSHLVLIIPMRTALSLMPPQIEKLLSLVEMGATLVSEGNSPLSGTLGFRPGKTIPVKHLEEIAYPDVEINWETEEQVTPFLAPDKATILSREPGSGASIVCLFPQGRGHSLLLAAPLNPPKGQSYARFPYFLHALQRAGVAFPFRSERLVALFDYAYRLNDNPDELAIMWRKTGIQAVHAGAWYYVNGDQQAEEYLKKMINACHRNGILVYAWLELPHVSQEFWQEHPKWREKTATGRDASIDWRLGMNLTDPECYRAVAEKMEQLFRKFDWDGVNLGELYFDSPAGKKDPDDFTPLNSFVRSEYKQRSGIDPVDFFKKESPNYWEKKPADWNRFVEYRVELEKNLTERFIQLFSGFRSSFSPNLDIVVTYVDNIYDPTMREAVGADVTVMFELLNRYDFTLVLEDPGTVWHLGPRRYAELAQTYSKMTHHAARLGVDINIVDRYIKSYPTDKQTGLEFLQLFFQAGAHFQTVMVYSEKTMLPQDADLVSCALAPNTRGEITESGVRIDARIPVVYSSGRPQLDFHVDGNPWPYIDRGNVWLPAGTHTISTGEKAAAPRPHLVKLNGDLISARYAEGQTIEFSYNAQQRAIVIFDRAPGSLQVDGKAPEKNPSPWMMLPRGAHKVLAAF
jgi:YD repeat-containing protein